MINLTVIGDIIYGHHSGKYISDIWVCLKIVYPIVPNGFADHYPYNK